MDQIFSAPSFDNAIWGIAVQSLNNGEMLYMRNADTLLIPASNMKVMTAAAALTLLGKDFTYETPIATDGQVVNGVLHGNLFIMGKGDPAISGRFMNGDPTSIFRNWADSLLTQGIRKIDGDVIGVTDHFTGPLWGEGWSWEDLDYRNAPEVSALQFNENVFTVTVTLNGVRKMDPPSSYFCVINHLQPAALGEQKQVVWKRQGNTVMVSGKLAVDDDDYGTFAVRNASGFFVTALRETLQASGIEVTGNAIVRGEQSYERPGDARTLFVHKSPPLSELLAVMLGVSHNLYAESIFKTLGYAAEKDGSFSGGKKAVSAFLNACGVAPQSYAIYDGSGLSRYNLLTPLAILQVLRTMKASPQFDTFYAALPAAGIGGTLKNRMKTTQAEGNVHAKTGALLGVRSLSGFVRTADGELLAFVMIANNFNVPRETAEYLQDLALHRLATFSRK